MYGGGILLTWMILLAAGNAATFMENEINNAEKWNMQAVLQLENQQYTVMFSVPALLEEHLCWIPQRNQPEMAVLQLQDGTQTGNIGTIVIYDAAIYDSSNPQEAPLGMEILREEENGYVLAYTGMQSAVFPEGTRASALAMLYHKYEREILSEIQVMRDMPEK